MRDFPRRPLLYAILILAGSFFFSCNKSSDPGDSNHSFTWTFEGITHTANQDTAFISGLGIGSWSVIYAGTGTSYLSYTRRFYFYLSSLNVGTYTFTTGPGAPNHFNYTDDLGFNQGGTNGTFNITANSYNKLSGNFSGSLTGPSGTQPVSGSFTNMPIKP